MDPHQVAFCLCVNTSLVAKQFVRRYVSLHVNLRVR